MNYYNDQYMPMPIPFRYDSSFRLDFENQCRVTAAVVQEREDVKEAAAKEVQRINELLSKVTKEKASCMKDLESERQQHAATRGSVLELKGVIHALDRSAADRETELVDKVSVNDIVFLFPVADSTPVVYRELWASSKKLSFSTYYSDMLSSGFIESDTTNLSYPPPNVNANHDNLDEDDSDSEAEANELESSSLTTPHEIHRIVIKDVSYRTYRAFLHFLYTGSVTFAKLRSVVASERGSLPSPETAKKRTQSDSWSQEEPPLKKLRMSELHALPPPSPVSPKSLYRLAHLTSHRLLQQECIAHLSQSLPAEVLIGELFSPFSLLYEDVRAVLIKLTVENWSKLKKINGSDLMKKELLEGDVQAKSAVAVDLMEKIFEKLEGENKSDK